jgi:hypothetical protein
MTRLPPPFHFSTLRTYVPTLILLRNESLNERPALRVNMKSGRRGVTESHWMNTEGDLMSVLQRLIPDIIPCESLRLQSLG